MLGVLNPVNWVTGILSKMKDVVVQAFKQPTPWNITKAAGLIYLLIPASVPWTLYKAAGWFGYEAEAEEFVGIMTNALGDLGWIALDATAKAVVWFILSVVGGFAS